MHEPFETSVYDVCVRYSSERGHLCTDLSIVVTAPETGVQICRDSDVMESITVCGLQPMRG